MPVWQDVTSAGRFRLDDKYGSPRQLEVYIERETTLRIEVTNLASDDPDGMVGVPILNLLAALQGAGVTAEQVRGVWGFPQPIVDRPRAVVDSPQA